MQAVHEIRHKRHVPGLYRQLRPIVSPGGTVASAHGEVFSDIRPANTIMQVSRFIDPDWLVELEADAVVEE